MEPGLWVLLVKQTRRPRTRTEVRSIHTGTSMSQSRLWSRHGHWNTFGHRHHDIRLLPILKRSYTSPAEKTLVHIPKSNVYRFGDSNIAAPVFHDVDWTVKEGQNWAVIGRGSSQKTTLLQVPCQNVLMSLGTTLTCRVRRRCADTCGSLLRPRLPVDSSLSCLTHREIRIPQFPWCPLPIDLVQQGVRSMTTPRDMVPSGRKIASRSERACLESTIS